LSKEQRKRKEAHQKTHEHPLESLLKHTNVAQAEENKPWRIKKKEREKHPQRNESNDELERM